MKIGTLCLLWLLAFMNVSATKKTKTKWVLVHGMVTQTADYCGGAMPSDEMLEQLKSPKPLADKELFIQIGVRNKPSRKGQNTFYKKVMTDKNGAFTVKLKSGLTYCFIEDWKAKPFKVPNNTPFVVWDAACLYEKYSNADYVLKLNQKSNQPIQINFHKPCFFSPYCGTYSGPLPP
jgi:hypothetical protein